MTLQDLIQILSAAALQKKSQGEKADAAGGGQGWGFLMQKSVHFIILCPVAKPWCREQQEHRNPLVKFLRLMECRIVCVCVCLSEIWFLVDLIFFPSFPFFFF